MQEQLNGTIDSIYTKTLKIKNGPRAGQDTQVYHAMINGYDINLGFKCDHVEGETVSLTVENGRFGYELSKSPNPNAPAISGAPAPTPSKDTPKARSAPAFPIAKNTKDISIIRQSSLNRAVDVVNKMYDMDVIAMFNNEQEYLDKIIEVALFFTDFGSGQREVNHAAAMQGYKDTDE